jgi:hypothetical protein
MIDLAEISKLAKTSIQLPIDWYLDPRILEIVK